MDHHNSHGLIDAFRQSLIDAKDEEVRQKMVDFLILNYVESKLHAPHQIGFLTGLKTYQTYSLRIDFDPKLKKEYSQLREQLQDYFKQISVESSYDYDSNGVTYLCDMNHEKLGKL